MTTADYIKTEAARMANLIEAAMRISDMLIKTDVAMTYEECEIVLNIVLRTIKTMTGKDDE